MDALLTEADITKLAGVDRIHLVFKTHFDLGFTDLAANVRSRYLNDYLPRALKLARRTREERTHRFVWTTGSWLVYESLEHGNATQRRQLEQAIAAGDVVWTAMPFTPHSELMGRDLFVLGLELSARLDARFGKDTIAANLIDVPGHTIGIVPLLARAGVRLLHIGVNPGSPLPAVPRSFVWHVPGDGASVVVSYNDDYGGVTRLGSSTDAMLMVFTDDNVGPPDRADVDRVYADLARRLPGVEIDATGMNAFAATVNPTLAELPVVERELGDSWLHGGASDPAKLAAYRELVRLRREWLANGEATATELDDASRTLMLVAEHTWGLDVKSHDPDRLAESWLEQRGYVEQAVELLPARLAGVARARLQGPPTLDDLLWEPATPDSHPSTDWVFPVATYQIFDAGDYARFHREYLRSDDPWALADFGKPGLDLIEAHCSEQWTATPTATYAARLDDATVVRRELAFPEETTALGAPRRLTYDLTVPDDAPELALAVRWLDKAPVTTPEALWLTFVVPGSKAAGWTLDKLGLPVSALDVDPRGGQLHAVERGVQYADEHRVLEIELLDTPIVSLLGPRLLRFDARTPRDGDDMSVCVFNNVWGTNYPQWYGEPGLARFVLRIDQGTPRRPPLHTG